MSPHDFRIAGCGVSLIFPISLQELRKCIIGSSLGIAEMMVIDVWSGACSDGQEALFCGKQKRSKCMALMEEKGVEEH